MKSVWFLVLSALAVGYCIEHDFKGFDDSILFGINWPGEKDGLYETIDKANKPKVSYLIGHFVIL